MDTVTWIALENNQYPWDWFKTWVTIGIQTFDIFDAATHV
jgi:hypothetical protein